MGGVFQLHGDGNVGASYVFELRGAEHVGRSGVVELPGDGNFGRCYVFELQAPRC